MFIYVYVFIRRVKAIVYKNYTESRVNIDMNIINNIIVQSIKERYPIGFTQQMKKLNNNNN